MNHLMKKLFDLQRTMNTEIIAHVRSMNLPVVGSGLTGGHHGTNTPYVDYKFRGNVIRVTDSGWSGQKPSASVVD